MRLKYLLAQAFFLLATSAVFSQIKTPAYNGKSISFGLDVDRVIGPLNDRYHYGFGGSVKLEIPVKVGLSLTASAGYVLFAPNGTFQNTIDFYNLDIQNYKFIPVKVGAKYYLTNHFYGEVQTGAVFSEDKRSTTGVIYSPGLGWSYAITDRHGVDLGIRYEGWTVTDKSGYQPANNVNNFIGFRVAYKFGL
jgi:hypothetical protein